MQTKSVQEVSINCIVFVDLVKGQSQVPGRVIEVEKIVILVSLETNELSVTTSSAYYRDSRKDRLHCNRQINRLEIVNET